MASSGTSLWDEPLVHLFQARALSNSSSDTLTRPVVFDFHRSAEQFSSLVSARYAAGQSWVRLKAHMVLSVQPAEGLITSLGLD